MKDMVPVFPWLRVFFGIRHMWCLLRISSLEVVGLGTFTFLEKKKKIMQNVPSYWKRISGEELTSGTFVTQNKNCLEVGIYQNQVGKWKSIITTMIIYWTSSFLLSTLPALLPLLLVSKLDSLEKTKIKIVLQWLSIIFYA